MDYLKAVEDKKAESDDLYKRQKIDADLLHLKKYTMKDKNDKDIPDIINVTLDDPAIFGANVVSSLGVTSEQIVVESEDKNIDTTYIEDFQRAARASANARLIRQGRPSLNPFFDAQLCFRGRAGFRCLFRMENGVLIPDIIPLDTRYLTYDIGEDGWLWGAYETTKGKAEIESKYPKVTVTGKGATMLDVWDREHNEIWIDKKKVAEAEQKHSYGYVPFGVATVSLGYGAMLLDKDWVQYEGESIFFLIRDLIPELNRLASIVQTLNMATIKGAKQFASKGGITATLPEGSDKMGALTAVDIGGGITLVPLADIKRAFTALHSMIETRIQRGSLSSIDLGTLSFPLSAVALLELGEGRDQVFLPRLDAKSLLNQQLADMFTAQVIQIGGSVELGTRGHKRSFDVGKLEGEYETRYRYFTKSPKIDAARYSVASVAKEWLDEDSILRDILQAEDPDGIKKKRYYDMAAVISPAVRRTRVIRALADGGDDEVFEAEIMAAEMGMDLERIMAGEVSKAPEPEKPAEPILPLLGRGGEVGGTKTSAKKAAELEATPREAEGEE